MPRSGLNKSLNENKYYAKTDGWVTILFGHNYLHVIASKRKKILFVLHTIRLCVHSKQKKRAEIKEFE